MKTDSNYYSPRTESDDVLKRVMHFTKFKCVEREEKDQEHEMFLTELNAWVDSLPDVSE